MAYSKELRIPKQWSKYHHDIVKETVDPALLNEDEITKSFITYELCDKSTAKKYLGALKPYYIMRCSAVFSPSNSLCRNIFKAWTKLYIGALISDDQLEHFSGAEIHQIRDSFEMLNETVCEQLPCMLTLSEMRQLLKISKKLVPHVIFHMDWLSTVANLLIQHGEFSLDTVRDYMRRLFAVTMMYLEALQRQVSSDAQLSTEEFILIRNLDGGLLFFAVVNEVMSGAIGKIRSHVTSITELYYLSAMVGTLINDCYSCHKETDFNVVQVLIKNKEASDLSEAVTRTAQIVNALIMYIYQTSEKIKRENSDNPELHNLLESIGMATFGLYFLHKITPRYKNTICEFSLVEVEEMELEEWRKSKAEEELDFLQHFLYRSNKKTQTIIDALSGVIKPRGHIVTE